MNKKKEFLGEVAPFGDGTEVCHFEGHVECTNFRREKGYEKLCKGCKATAPEAIKDYIGDDVNEWDEPYYCYWCDFIRVTEIDGILVEELKKASLEEEKKKYNKEEEWSITMQELEDTGAFSDEGIMPGCHSMDWEIESEVKEIMQEFKDMAFVGLCVKLAREKAGLSIEVLADKLKMPETFINDIENGECINFYGNKPIDLVANYLCDVFNQNITRECDKDEQPKAADPDDMLPF